MLSSDVAERARWLKHAGRNRASASAEERAALAQRLRAITEEMAGTESLPMSRG